jgi:hypothetical protein
MMLSSMGEDFIYAQGVRDEPVIIAMYATIARLYRAGNSGEY